MPDLPVLAAVRGVTVGVLVAVVVVAAVVARFVAKLVVRLVLLAVLALVALGVWVERDEVARCADTCTCEPFGRAVDVPFCRERLDEVPRPTGVVLAAG